MHCTIAPSSDGKYIVPTCKDEINRAIAMQQNRQAHALGKELGINRYLVDATGARNTDTIKDSYNFAYADVRNTNDIDKTAVVALLVSPDDHSHDFIEAVARNTGLNVTNLTERRLAESFLGQ